MPARPDEHAVLPFRAPVGRQVRAVSLLALSALFVAGLLPAALGRPARWTVPALGVAVVGPIWFFARVKGYRLAQDEVQVLRPGRVQRYPLAGLIGAEADPRAFEGAWRTWGNGGLGAITGRFDSAKLGRFRAAVSDEQSAVVLRWPERVLVVSPERPAYFVTCLRERVKLQA